MKKVSAKFLFVCLIAVCLCSLVSCKEVGSVKEVEKTDFEEYLVVLNKSDMTNHKVQYDIQAEDTHAAISELLEALNIYIDDEYTSPLSDKTNIISFGYEDGSVTIYFDAKYNEQLITEEVVARSAIVDTLCQLDEVEDVSFYVEEAPLTIQGTVIGRMNSNTFLYDIVSSNETTMLTLYFPNEDFTGLVEITREVDVDARYTDEQMVIEELLKGPQKGEAVKTAIPSGTKLLNVVTKDMICYVNLSAEFISYMENVPDELTVYSLVNSISEITGIRSVVISVDGQKLEYYRTLMCGDFLTVNYDLLITNE